MVSERKTLAGSHKDSQRIPSRSFDAVVLWSPSSCAEILLIDDIVRDDVHQCFLHVGIDFGVLGVRIYNGTKDITHQNDMLIDETWCDGGSRGSRKPS